MGVCFSTWLLKIALRCLEANRPICNLDCCPYSGMADLKVIWDDFKF